VRFAAVQGGVSNFALTGYGALMVLFLVRDLRLDPGWVGIVIAVGSADGLVGATVARRAAAPPRRRAAAPPHASAPGPPWPGCRSSAAPPRCSSPPPGRVCSSGVPLGAALVGVGVVGATSCALPSGCAMSRLR